MSVPYKLYADDDPGGTLESAFATMEAATVNTTPKYRLTYMSIASKVDLAAAIAIEKAIDGAIGLKAIPKWVATIMVTTGLDINDPQVQMILGQLIGANLSEAQADKILAVGVVKEPMYPGIKIGHLNDARVQRKEGNV